MDPDDFSEGSSDTDDGEILMNGLYSAYSHAGDDGFMNEMVEYY